MPVEDVYKPKTVKAVDPKAAHEKDQGEEGYWSQKAREAKARLDYQEYEHAMQMMGQQPEAPFKVSGEVSLGKIDFQEQQRQEREQSEKARKEKDEQIQKERERAQQLEQQLYTERMEGLRRDFDSKIGDLHKTIEKLIDAKQKDERPLHEQFRDQFTALNELAKEMGLERTSSGQDPMIQLELAKLQYQTAREEREFKREMRNDEKRWQIELQKLQDDREYKRAQIEQQSRKDDFIASGFQHIGGAIAQGMRESEGGPPQPGHISQPARSGAQAYRLRIPPNAAKTFACPNCKTAVSVGPTTVTGQCIECGTQFLVVREDSTPGTAGPENGEQIPGPPPPYDEEEEQ